jgi:quinol monooxygenase YgiN
MIVRIVKLTLDPANVDQFLDIFDQVREPIRDFEGCLYTEMLIDSVQSGIVFTYSHWKTEEDLEKYRKSELFQLTWSRVKPLFAAKAEAWTLHKQVDNPLDK